MVQTVIVKGFTLTHDKSTVDDANMFGKEEYIAPGVHDFPESIASHWFVAAHSDHPPASAPRAGTPEYGAAQAAQMRRRKIVEAVIEQEAADAAAQIKKDALLSGRYGQQEEEVHAEEAANAAEDADAAEVNEAARTGRKVALPQRRGAAPSVAVEPPPA